MFRRVKSQAENALAPARSIGGKDEYRLYEAALAIEQVMLKMEGIREVQGF